MPVPGRARNEEAAKFREQFAELKASQPLDPQQRYQVLSTAEARRAAVTTLCEAATVHSWQKDFLEAERLLLRALALDPTHADSCRALAALYRGAKMLAEERVVWQRLVEIEPHNFNHYLRLAKVCDQLGDAASAEATLKLAMAIWPEAADAYAMLAQFYLQAGKAPQARWYAQEAVRREPSAEGYRFVASTCRLLGDTAAAEAALAKARELGPGSPKPPAGQPATTLERRKWLPWHQIEQPRAAQRSVPPSAGPCSPCSIALIPAHILAAQPAECSIRLIDVTESSGITFRHNHGGSDRGYIVEGMASGLALFDYDGDGLIDIYFLNGAPLQGTVVDDRPRNALVSQ